MRRRHAAFAALLSGCALATAATIATAVRGGEPAASPVVVEPGSVVFRSGERLAVARGSGGRRTVTGLRCERVHHAAARGLCVTRGDGFAAGYEAVVLDGKLRAGREIGLAGIPSRARVSPDGRLGSVTMFVTGHSYAETGAFSTQTTLLDLERGEPIADLEDFTVLRDGRHVASVDRNFWGVTFARDGDSFYATMATGGVPYLIEGSVKGRSARVVRAGVECPSLSPDGTRIAFKSRTDGGPAAWRPAVLDLTTRRVTRLAEPRGIDDQIEWLDDGTVAYGLDGAVWRLRADGRGGPARLLAGASSPAAVR
jgi:hypothetical protein